MYHSYHLLAVTACSCVFCSRNQITQLHCSFPLRMEEVKTFAENTSMKGVARFMKTRSLPVRILWLTSVLVLLAVSVNGCVQLIQRYRQYPKLIKVEDINAFGDDYTDYSDMFSLPDVTICNQNPLTAYNEYDSISWNQYLAITSPLFSDANQTMRGRYLSPRGYLEHIGVEAIIENQAIHEFVIDCVYGYILDSDKIPCDHVLQMSYFPNVLYSQCYTVQLHATYIPNKISLTVYLDDINAAMVEYEAETRATRGVVVSIHGRGEIPSFENAYFASAGQLTTFTVKKTLYERVQDPYDPCWEDSTDESSIQSVSGLEYRYSQMGCSLALFQAAVLEACDCISSELLVLPVNPSQEHVHFCGAASINVTQVMLENECENNAVLENLPIHLSTCIPPCNETFHSVTISSSPWPTENAQLSFYEKYIRHKSYGAYFAAHENIYMEFMNTSDVHKAMAHIHKLSHIEKNFAKVEIVLPATHGELYRVSYQLTLASLIASIGGTLNLWSGISAIIIIELLDLIIRLLMSARKQQQRPESPSRKKQKRFPDNQMEVDRV